MFWLFLESGRLVLEQLELCLNSRVCSNEAELHLKMKRTTLYMYVYLMQAQVSEVLKTES